MNENSSIYKHRTTGNIGYHFKEYKPTGRPVTIQIKMSDGRIYFAPKHEFELIS